MAGIAGTCSFRFVCHWCDSKWGGSWGRLRQLVHKGGGVGDLQPAAAAFVLVLLASDLVEVVALEADHLAAVRAADDVGAVGVAADLADEHDLVRGGLVCFGHGDTSPEWRDGMEWSRFSVQISARTGAHWGMRVYHFCNKEFGLANIEKRRLKISTFLDLNDPFELLCHNVEDEILRRQMEWFKKDMASRHGMICFSKSSSSPVQWAHYSERHAGICLGFDVPDGFVTEVVYTNNRLDFQRVLEEDWDGLKPQVNQMLITKYEHWSYEQEVRVFGDLGTPDAATGIYFQRFDENLVLKEVAVGFNSAVTRSELAAHLGDLADQVECYKVRPAFTSYDMVRNKDDSFWR